MQWEDTGSLQHVSKDLDGRIMAMKITLRPRSKSIYSTIRRQFGKALEEHELKELSKDKQATKFQYPEKALREWGKTNWKSILTILWLWFGQRNLKTYNTRSSFNGIKSRGHYTHLRETIFISTVMIWHFPLLKCSLQASSAHSSVHSIAGLIF